MGVTQLAVKSVESKGMRQLLPLICVHQPEKKPLNTVQVQK